MIQDMKTTLTRLFTVMMLIMVSMVAQADVKVLFGEDGKELEPGKNGTITLSQKEVTGGTITITQEKPTDGKVRVNFNVAPASGYIYTDGNITLVAFYPLSSTRADSPAEDITVHSTLTLTPKDKSQTDTSKPRNYYVDIDEGLGLWVQSATFEPKKREGAKGKETYWFYVINNNGKQSVCAKATVETSSTALEAFKAIATNIVSPFILDNNYYFYDTETDAKNATGLTNGGGNGSSTVEVIDGDNDKNIYVRYYYDASLSPTPIDLSGSVQYNIMIGGRYFLFNVSRTQRPESIAPADVTDAMLQSTSGTIVSTINGRTDQTIYFLWKFTGNDPYNITVTSCYDPGDKFLWGQWGTNGSTTTMWLNNGTSNNVKLGSIQSTNVYKQDNVYNLASFILLPHSSDNGYVLMAATTLNQPKSNGQYAYQMNSKSTGSNYDTPYVRFSTAASAEVVSIIPITKCETPTVTYDNSTGNVTIESATTGADIYYTVDGSTEPSSSATRYTAPFNISATTTIKAIAIKADRNNSVVSTKTISKLSTPTITVSGSSIIITADNGTTIHYTTDGTPPTMGSSVYSTALSVTDYLGKTIQAIAVKAGSITSDIASQTVTLTCAQPVISVDKENKKFSITCSEPTSGVTIYYTIDESDPSASATREIYLAPVDFDDYGFTVKAIAVADGGGYSPSVVAEKYIQETLNGSGTAGDPYLITSSYDYGLFVNMVNYDGAGACYLVTDDNITANGIITATFTGTFDGGLHAISGLSNPLFPIVYDGTVKNVILDNVGINSGINVGAICGEATGDTRIYNCGVLATNSTATTDKEGYTEITNCSSTISGSGYVGGLVGLLEGTSRVINCFSYANVSSGNYVGGIVGYNNVAYDATDHKTMVMNCMFYGEVSGSSIAPIYNGAIITNDGDADGVNNFNYFRLESSYIKNTEITKVYNCALGAETRFLQRFEFFRHLLNSNRELAAWWATGNAANKGEMMKWVLEPSQIGSSTPYPILKTPGKYASVVNYTPSTTPYNEANRNTGRKLTSEGDDGVLHVTIQMGSGGAHFEAPSGARLKSGETGKFDLTITDKDFVHFNFNYGKVQLPYYNDYCDGNYTENCVVTGWKIVSITGGTKGSYSTGDDVTYNDKGELTATPYNFADRKCTNKDLYGTNGSNRVFNQGAYWDVPDGVTAITIEPYWGKAVYLSDAYWDVTYKNSSDNTDAMATAANVTTVGGGQHYGNGETFKSQTVYTSIGDAIASTALYAGTNQATYSARSVYDYAVVLVGNYHNIDDIAGGGKPYTVTSVDLDGDNEPDYSFMLRFNSRKSFHPVRYDFLNLMGLGMAQKTTGGTGSYNFGIMQPKYWFEVTNTALFRVTQFEYSQASREKKPYILQGGVIEQWVSLQQEAGDRVSYFLVGGNVWFKEFHRGSHQDNEGMSTSHPPLSVTGGDFSKFYLTGYYQSKAKIYNDNAECYINGGRFGEIAGAGMEGIGTSDGKGNITWIIDNADIKEFYGGGINHAKPVHGNIHTIISNSHVDVFSGGPKFGNMEAGRTVTTTATNCTFGTYFGAGYGGNSYNRYAPRNHNNIINFPHNDKQAGNDTSWNGWLSKNYNQDYDEGKGGVSTQFDYQFLPMSGNLDNVARIFVEYVAFSLATCHNVTSSLTGCTITGNFYGGGSLGKVDGDVTSTLTNCTVNGSVFGAGYSASLPPVEVMDIGFETEPYYYEDLGTYRTGVFPATTTYTWQHGDDFGINTTDHILYTTENLNKNNLGSVSGNVTLTIQTEANKTTTIGTAGNSDTGNVFGGGEQSYVTNTPATDTTSEVVHTVIVNVKGPGTTNVLGNVYGGGDKGVVEGSTVVNIGE